MDEDTRPLKRVRQACEPCRRKKTRCPGERPVCSYCHRLGQQCIYNDNENEVNAVRQNRKMEERIDNLEGKMDQLIRHLMPTASPAGQAAPLSRIPTPESCEAIVEPWLESRNNSVVRRDSDSHGVEDQDSWPFKKPSTPRTTTELVQEDHSLYETIRLYFKWCHNQPITLFREDAFLESLKSRDYELLLALKALGLRFTESQATPAMRERLDGMATLSRQRTMDCVVNGRVKLSTLQSLCLLSLIDMADGRTVQASVHLSIARTLSMTISNDSQERKDCIRSISVLQQLQGCVVPATDQHKMGGNTWPGSTDFSARGSFLKPPSNPTALHDSRSPDSLLDVGILKYTSQLCDVWHMVRMYAAHRVGPDTPPPWDPRSDYSAVTQRHLEVDCSVPLKYRFAANKFGDQTPEALQKNRHYWGPWLFLQFIYAAIPCLLNHPFLLSMRLRNFRHTMPQSFIHQSFELISRHAGWITYFIDLLERKFFQPSDPALAHCVVIVATIHLQHSFVDERFLREQALAGFDKCMGFLRRMGSIWPWVSVMADNLQKLQGSVAVTPSLRPANEEHSGSRQVHSIDAQLLWNMLIYERSGHQDATADQSMFDGSLTPTPSTIRGNDQDETTAEFDLVGSAGISGHRTVPKECPVYPPEDATTLPEQTSGTPDMMLGETVMSTDLYRYLDGVEGESNYEGLAFQAQDFSRVIEDWMNIDLG